MRTSPSPASLRLWLSLRLLAPSVTGCWTAAPGAEPVARANAEACRGAFIGRRGSRLLGQFPHLTRSGHRGSDALRWSTLVRSARPELRRSAAARISNPRAGQRKQVALVAASSRNHKTAGSLPSLGAAAKLRLASVCRSQGAGTGKAHDIGGGALTVPASSSNHPLRSHTPPPAQFTIPAPL